MERTAIAGSAPDHTGCRRERAADADAPVRATIVLRPRDPGQAEALLSGKYQAGAHMAMAVGDNAVAETEAFARAHGLTVEPADPGSRSIAVSGPASRMDEAFGVRLGMFASEDGTKHLSYDGDITLPAELAPYVMAVLGLDTRPVARWR